ncbi:MAG: nuclear transport factor 2 family protein [Sediminibacterium sp.]|nr:nuclear transport factor 2 family protein [Sediminibacterium sp.]
MEAFHLTTTEVERVVQNYFKGVFVGDVELLKQQFHSHCLLVGDINGVPYFKTLTAYLEGVANRKSPADLGEKFGMKIIGIDYLGTSAMVKAYLPMLGYHYYDVLTLANPEGNWKIVHKLFTHIEHENSLE